MAYDTGDLVRVVGRFRNPDNADAYLDPTAVKFTFKAPGGSAVTYTYGTDVELVKETTGVYHVDLNVSTAGHWTWRWWSTGTGQAAEEGDFTVKATTV